MTCNIYKSKFSTVLSNQLSSIAKFTTDANERDQYLIKAFHEESEIIDIKSECKVFHHSNRINLYEQLQNVYLN